MRKILIFTDLDGTFLDHHTYSAALSAPFAQVLHRRGVPVVFCSSKTFAEQRWLQSRLGFRAPFILENGSAIAVPKGYFDVSGHYAIAMEDYDLIPLAKHGRAQILDAMKGLNRADLISYATATTKQIAEATDLQGESMTHALNRLYTETVISGTFSLTEIETLANAGFSVSQGGRFQTIQDRLVDKGEAVKKVISLFQNLWKHAPFSIGIGDSLNDEPMLKVVDEPYLVQGPTGKFSALDVKNLIKLEAIGPLGFCELAGKLLTRL